MFKKLLRIYPLHAQAETRKYGLEESSLLSYERLKNVGQIIQ